MEMVAARGAFREVEALVDAVCATKVVAQPAQDADAGGAVLWHAKDSQNVDDGFSREPWNGGAADVMHGTHVTATGLYESGAFAREKFSPFRIMGY